VIIQLAMTRPEAIVDSEILTAEDVAMRLKLRPETIYELTRRRCRRPLPAHRAGKVLRFLWSEVLAWFLEGQQSGSSRVKSKELKR
jgi:hypothetical protein